MLFIPRLIANTIKLPLLWLAIGAYIGTAAQEYKTPIPGTTISIARMQSTFKSGMEKIGGYTTALNTNLHQGLNGWR